MLRHRVALEDIYCQEPMFSAGNSFIGANFSAKYNMLVAIVSFIFVSGKFK